jgi:hypothetical protein
MHIIWELEVLRKEFFVCLKICIIDETIFFDGRCFRRGSHRYTFFSIHIPSNFVQVHNVFSFRYKRIEKFHNANLFENTIFASIVNYDWSMIKVNLTGYALKCTLYPNICNKTPENYTQIYAVWKLVPKCAYLSRTEIGLVNNQMHYSIHLIPKM